MIPENSLKDSQIWMLQNLDSRNQEIEKLLCRDLLCQSSLFQNLQQDFIKHFNELGEEKAQWLFYKSFNDTFLAEKNYISCPLW